MNWVLIVVTLVGGTSPQSSTEAIHFRTQAACEAAKIQIEQITQTQTSGFGSGQGTRRTEFPGGGAVTQVVPPPPYFSRLARCIAN